MNLPRILDLLLTCEAAGHVDMELHSTGLRLTLTNPAFDVGRYTLPIEEDGRLLGFGVLWRGRVLGMLVHPAARGRLEERMLDWALATVRADGVETLIALAGRTTRSLVRSTNGAASGFARRSCGWAGRWKRRSLRRHSPTLHPSRARRCA